jgi:hypothetical protein
LIWIVRRQFLDRATILFQDKYSLTPIAAKGFGQDDLLELSLAMTRTGILLAQTDFLLVI